MRTPPRPFAKIQESCACFHDGIPWLCREAASTRRCHAHIVQNVINAGILAGQGKLARQGNRQRVGECSVEKRLPTPFRRTSLTQRNDVFGCNRHCTPLFSGESLFYGHYSVNFFGERGLPVSGWSSQPAHGSIENAIATPHVASQGKHKAKIPETKAHRQLGLKMKPQRAVDVLSGQHEFTCK